MQIENRIYYSHVRIWAISTPDEIFPLFDMSSEIKKNIERYLLL